MQNLKRKNSIEFNPIHSFENNMALMNDGCISFGYEVSEVEQDGLSKSQLEKLNELMVTSIKGLPIGSTIHKMDVYYNEIFEGSRKPNSYFTNKLIDHLEGRKMLFKKSFIFVSLPARTNGTPVNALTSSFVATIKDHFAVLKNPFKDIEERQQKARRISKAFPKAFNGLNGIYLNMLTGDEILEFSKMYASQDFVNKPKNYNRSITADASTVYVGEKGQQFVSLRGQGLSVSDEVRNEVGIISPFSSPLGYELYFPHTVHCVIRVNDTQKELKSLDFSAKINSSLEIGGGQENEMIAAETKHLTAEIRATSMPMVSLKLTVQLSEIDPNKRQRQVDETLLQFAELNGAECYVETFDPLQTFLSLYPCNASQTYNLLDMPADNAACYFNWITNYRADKNGIILMDRMRNPLCVDILSPKLNSRNGIFIGPTGSGKSFTAGFFMLQFYEQGLRQIVIDNGGTYKNLIKHSLGERYIEYDFDNPIKLNPFNIDRDQNGNYDLRIGDKLQFLISLLTVIWKGKSGENVTDNAQNSVFEKLIPRFYHQLEKKEIANITKFYQWLFDFVEYNEKILEGGLDEYADKEITSTEIEIRNRQRREYRQMADSFNFSQFLLTLEKFTLNKSYGEVFNSDKDEDISSYRLTCFDMAKIKSNPTIYPVIALVITELSLDVIRKYPDDYKNLWIDEAWSLLEGLNAFIELMYRTIRKNNGSIHIITQSTAEINNSPIRSAILNNSSIHVILDHSGAQKEDAIEQIQGHLGYTDQDIDKIKSLQRDSDGKWREIFVKLGDHAKVYVVEGAAEIAAALTSNANDRNRLNKLIERFKNPRAAINQFVADQNEVA